MTASYRPPNGKVYEFVGLGVESVRWLDFQGPVDHPAEVVVLGWRSTSPPCVCLVGTVARSEPDLRHEAGFLYLATSPSNGPMDARRQLQEAADESKNAWSTRPVSLDGKGHPALVKVMPDGIIGSIVQPHRPAIVFAARGLDEAALALRTVDEPLAYPLNPYEAHELSSLSGQGGAPPD